MFSSIHTNENAPRSVGSTATAFSSRLVSGWCASSAVTRLVSLVDSRVRTGRSSSPWTVPSSPTRRASSRVLVRLPLCASAMDPLAVGRNVGWALCQVLAPVVE